MGPDKGGKVSPVFARRDAEIAERGFTSHRLTQTFTEFHMKLMAILGSGELQYDNGQTQRRCACDGAA